MNWMRRSESRAGIHTSLRLQQIWEDRKVCLSKGVKAVCMLMLQRRLVVLCCTGERK